MADEVLKPAELVNFIGRWKNQSVRPDQAAALATSDKEHLASAGYRRYQRALHHAGAVDFDDLLLCVEDLFEKFADVRAAEAFIEPSTIISIRFSPKHHCKLIIFIYTTNITKTCFFKPIKLPV